MYNVRLTDIFRPGSGLTPGFLLSLIKNLPISSRFYAEKRGGQHFRGWDESRYALAAVVNAVRALQFTYIAAHSKSKPQQPQPFPTPDRPMSRGVKAGAFAAMAAAQLKRKG